MNVFAAMLARVQAAGDALAAEGVLPANWDRARVTVEPARDPAYGDMTTNAALVLAGEAGRAPYELAEIFAGRLRADASVERAEVAGPGFINITLRPAVWTEALRAMLLGSTASTVAPRPIETAGGQDVFGINRLDEISHVMDEGDRSAVRFIALFHGYGSELDVDLADAREQSSDNPVFCVQYGHARARAILGRARGTFQDLPVDAPGRAMLWRDAALALLTEASERALLRRIAQYPHVVETAGNAGEPRRVAVYLHDLARAFHTHTSHGIATPHLRFIIQNDRELTVARLALVEAVVIILAAGLALLGVGAPDEIT